jgi:hypothetical protein
MFKTTAQMNKESRDNIMLVSRQFITYTLYDIIVLHVYTVHVTGAVIRGNEKWGFIKKKNNDFKYCIILNTTAEKCIIIILILNSN